MIHRFHGSLVCAYAKLIEISFTELKKNVSIHEIEELAVFLTRAMGSESRDYHRPEHPLDVAKGLPPIASLAGLFHDIVYVQVDPTWQSTLQKLFNPFVVSADYKLNVVAALETCTEKWIKVAAVIFGIESETALPLYKGVNEFLSTIVMIRKIGSYLSDLELIKAIACVESTIPFRKPDNQGLTPADRLATRLKLGCKAAAITNFNGRDIDDIINECRLIVEKDMASFGSETTSDYLSNTWDVIFENYPALRNSYFSIAEYRLALFNTYSFINSLHPSFLFWVDESKSTKHQCHLRDNAKRNLIVTAEYLRAQIIGAVVIESIALESGGDAPWELFVGPVKRSREQNLICLELFLNIPKLKTSDQLNVEVFNILYSGRGSRSRFDRKNSPLAAYLYSTLNKKEFEKLLEMVPLFIEKKISSSKILEAIPQSILVPLLRAISKTATTRQLALEELENNYFKKELKAA